MPDKLISEIEGIIEEWYGYLSEGIISSPLQIQALSKAIAQFVRGKIPSVAQRDFGSMGDYDDVWKAGYNKAIQDFKERLRK